MLILAVDTETTGLDSEKDRIIELGWCLWDTEAKKPLLLQNDLLEHPGLEIPPEITEITGITKEMIDCFGQYPEAVLRGIELALGFKPAAVVAHNAPFDKAMLDAEFARFNLSPLDVLWVDTATDIPYPKKMQTRKLTHLCAEHGFLNPFPHRAITDVLSMLQMTSGYDWDTILEVAKSPSIEVEAYCQKPWQDTKPEGKKDTDIAKGMGFRFNPKSKQWLRNLRLCHLDEFKEQATKEGLQYNFTKGEPNASKEL